eukprot:6980328-Pyramimonas_sp.AAC.1
MPGRFDDNSMACSIGRAPRFCLDSMVNTGALSNRRSGHRQLRKVVRIFSAWELTTGARAAFGFASSPQPSRCSVSLDRW